MGLPLFSSWTCSGRTSSVLYITCFACQSIGCSGVGLCLLGESADIPCKELTVSLKCDAIHSIWIERLHNSTTEMESC